MPDTLSNLDDPVTAERMEAVNQARILLASHDHRKDLAEMAKISTELISNQEAFEQARADAQAKHDDVMAILTGRHKDLQAAIDARNKVYIAAEEALHGHLATKHT